MKELKIIDKFNPCREAINYLKTKDTFKRAWKDCPRGDWMLWLAQRLKVNLKTLTKAKALCALTVRHLMKDERSINACKVALKYSKGKATKKQLDAAAYAAADADAAAYAAAAADADAAYAAYAAYAAAYAGAYAGAAIKNQQKTADICREVLTSGS